MRVADSGQAKILARREGDEGVGFLAVSRGSGLGEVIAISNGLWWHLNRTEDLEENDNDRLMENLFAP